MTEQRIEEPELFAFRIETDRGRFYASVQAPDQNTAFQLLMGIIQNFAIDLTVKSMTAMKYGVDIGESLTVWLRRLPGDGYVPIDPVALTEAAAWARGTHVLMEILTTRAGKPIWELFGRGTQFEIAMAMDDALSKES